ncbi:uncharacterized protein LOC144452048 [Glandiceps talaboti]
MKILLALVMILVACGIAAGKLKPVGFWPLDRFSQLKDTSGNGNHGEAVGASLVTDIDGSSAGAYTFAGNANSYIEFPNEGGAYDAQKSITMLAYINPSGNAGPIFNFKRDGWGAHLWQTAPDQLFVRFVKRDMVFTDAVTADVLTQNEWSFVGASYNYDTGDAKLWQNGKEVATLNIGQVELATQYEARMGARIGDPRFFSGMITCMQVYDTALTAEEIQEAEIQCAVCP